MKSYGVLSNRLHGASSLKVLALLGHDQVGGCEIYRITMPFAMLRQHGWATEWMSLQTATSIANNGGLAAILDHDIFVFPRLVPEQEHYGVDALRQLVQGMGKLCVYETDDDYTNEHRKVHGGGKNAIEMAGKCDAVTVSTPYLRRLMMKRGSKNVHHLPNCVHMGIWERTKEFRKPMDYLTIGLTGSTTHKDDWRVLVPIMKGILEDYPEARFLVGGYHPEYFRGLPRTLFAKPVPYEQYPLLVAAADIVLCPVDPYDRFNYGKSSIKALEGMAAARYLPNGKVGGGAVIASDLPIYRRAINNRSNGLLTKHTPEAWNNAIRRVLSDEALRLKMQMTGHKWVRKNRNIEETWKLWAKTYQSIFTSGVKQQSRRRRVMA